MMLGRKPWFYWRFCWCFMTPLILLVVIVFKAVQYEPIKLGDYVYPEWGVALWWLVCLFPTLAIPGWFLYKFCAEGGYQVWKEKSKPLKDWGPANPENRTGKYGLSTDGQMHPMVGAVGIDNGTTLPYTGCQTNPSFQPVLHNNHTYESFDYPSGVEGYDNRGFSTDVTRM